MFPGEGGTRARRKKSRTLFSPRVGKKKDTRISRDSAGRATQSVLAAPRASHRSRPARTRDRKAPLSLSLSLSQRRQARVFWGACEKKKKKDVRDVFLSRHGLFLFLKKGHRESPLLSREETLRTPERRACPTCDTRTSTRKRSTLSNASLPQCHEEHFFPEQKTNRNRCVFIVRACFISRAPPTTHSKELERSFGWTKRTRGAFFSLPTFAKSAIREPFMGRELDFLTVSSTRADRNEVRWNHRLGSWKSLNHVYQSKRGFRKDPRLSRALREDSGGAHRSTCRRSLWPRTARQRCRFRRAPAASP